MFTSMSPNPFFARWAFNSSSDSFAVMSGTKRKSSFAIARPGKIVFPPGPVYPPTSPSIFTVGLETSNSNACSQLTSCTHR